MAKPTMAHRATRFLMAAMATFTLVFAVTTIVSVGAAVTATQAQAAVVSSISVRGNQRVDDETVRSYVTVQPGVRFTSFDTDESLAALFATGLFSDVRISQSGSTLIVEVQENSTINLVIFEGNDKVKTETLERITQSESLGVFSQQKLDSDIERVKG
ncbi:MAG: POTRA domain-containing protein, partial [Pseudomonadota bacterium]